MAHSTERLTAALDGRYTIERELGAGGMATVYLAQDLKHDRNVAIKVLKPELAAVLGAERFVQEIKTTAALSHPHILPLFDSGEAGGFLYYVMPYIQGETIREKLNRERQFGIEEALRITREVADALDYAHRQGVIHRDIKPENILLHDGRPMVMDFGIALAVSAAAGGRMTETGLSLGTPHYMSPEQATADRDITGRSDVYSLASVAYEMLTGEPPHMGTSAQQIIMKIIAEPVKPATELRKTVPAHVAAALSQALEKLPADRFDSAKAFAEALGNAGFSHATVAMASAGAAARGQRLRDPVFLLTAIAAVVGAAAALWGGRPGQASPTRSLAFRVADDQARVFSARTQETTLAISPDGKRVAYTAEFGAAQAIAVRDLGTFEAQRISGTEDATLRVFSPDGQSLVFRSGANLLRVELDGSPPVRVASLDRLNAINGMVWAPGDTLYYISEGARALFKQAMDGRSSVQQFPYPEEIIGVLAGLITVPGTDWLLSAQIRVSADQASVVAFSRRTGEFRLLALRGYVVHVLKGGTEILLYQQGGVITATAFDPKRLEATGASVAVLEALASARSGPAEFAMADDGTAFFATGEQPEGLIVEVTRDGRVTPLVRQPDTYKDPRWSPDERRLAFEISRGAEGDIWIYNRDTETATRLTTGSENFYPVWTRDGERIVFASRRSGAAGMWWQRVDGSAPAEALQARDSVRLRFPHAITPDGRTLIFRENAASTGLDIAAMDLAPAAPMRGVLNSPTNEGSPVISPDGRWLAFVSDATGRNEVYVTPWPDAGRRVQISTAGGEEAVWNPRGGELFFRHGDALVAVRLSERGGLVEPTRRDTLFTGSFYAQPRWPQYDVSADGNRFVFVQVPRETSELRVITRFDDVVRARLRARDGTP